MIRLSPKKLRDFNRQLFAEPTFDAFLAPEAHFVTAFRTDFSERPSEVSSSDGAGEDLPSGSPCPLWKDLRPIALALVRGTPPKSFSVVLKLPDDQTERVLAAAGLTAEAAGVSGFYLNIRYAKEELVLTSGCTQKTFSLDRSGEKAWDRYLEIFLSRLGLI